MDPERERVAELIRSAFDGVVLGDGIGLRQAEGFDDYESKTRLEELRTGDEKESWAKISAADLDRCSSSLSYFDAEGMRFHLPAYLISELVGTARNSHLVFSLTDISPYRVEQYASLSNVQRHAVSEFLLLLMDDPEFEFERDSIRQARAGFWAEGTSNAR